jgi:uncharacterized membrane protein YtjA (UPF0391 family)
MGKLTHWAVVFSIIAALYAMLGFGGGAGQGSFAAEILFWAALTVAIATLIASRVRTR